MIFNYKESLNLNLGDWFAVLWHGMRLDLSAGAYLMIIPTIILGILNLFNGKLSLYLINIYTNIFLFLILFLGVVDMELYSYWGFKLDITPVIYLKNPKDAFASTSYIETGLLIAFLALLYYFWYHVYQKLIHVPLKGVFRRSWLFSVTSFFLLGFLLIPIRGGLGIAPINISSAYFHTNRFANQSAVNVLWNTVYSIVDRKKLQTTYKFMEGNRATELFQGLYPKEHESVKVLKGNSNVILFILESFSNIIIGELGGKPGITPSMDKLCRNSMIFSNFFATGDRSDKGIVGILSGFPAQPTTSIINYPSKTQSLPFLLKPFHDNGYYTAFYYGGDLNFANFKSYFSNPAMDKLITVNDFPSDLNMQKWGVPDEYLFERILAVADTIKSPFFIYCFTLSSHEPYDIPEKPFFGNSTIDQRSESGFYYTDKCIGKFIENARNKPWWDNTLIIFLADHGTRNPGLIPNHVKEKFQIPMIWTGGAVLASDTVIKKFSSQTDLPLTLLRQFGYEHDGYNYSKDIFDNSSPSFAMYFFNNGFSFISDSTSLIYDNNIRKFILEQGKDTSIFQEPSKAYLQKLSGDFYSR
jgi:phosphoglycerol transferase MdoB-like AlkP superfamily enzyme